MLPSATTRIRSYGDGEPEPTEVSGVSMELPHSGLASPTGPLLSTSDFINALNLYYN